MSSVLTSREAADLYCEKNRTNFLDVAALFGIFVVIGGICLVAILCAVAHQTTPLDNEQYALILIISALVSYPFVVIVSSIIMHFRHDGKYCDDFTLQSSWYNWIKLFQKKVFPINDLADIRKHSGKWVLVNGVQLTDFLKVSSKSFNSDYGPGCKDTWNCTINYKGKHCIGSFQTLDENFAPSELNDGMEEYLIAGKINGSVITKLRAMNSLLLNTEYTKEYFLDKFLVDLDLLQIMIKRLRYLNKAHPR